METKTQTYENKLIVLTDLNNEIEDSLKERKRWVTVVDVEGNAEIFFKYQGTSYFSILEKEVAPENLGRSLLTMVKYPRTLTINYLDLPYQNIFDEKYFPQELLDHEWISNYKNIEKIREHFLQEFPEEIFPCPDFKLCFLFRKDNVPEILHQRTDVLEICSPDEIEEKIAAQKERQEAKKAAEVKEAKVEETKTDAKTSAEPAKKGTTASKTPTKTTATTAKTTTTSTTKSTTTSATKTPVKTTVSSTGSKSTTTKSSVPSKTTPAKK